MLTEVEIYSDTDLKVSRILEECPEQIKDNLQEKLIQDAQFYIEKKRRQQEKKERVLKMEQDYQKLTEKKRQNLKDKITKSAKAKQKSQEQINRRLRKNSEHFKSVVTKICHKNESDLENKLMMRKEMYNDESHLSRSFSKTGKDHLKGSRTQPIRINTNEVERKIELINYKAKKAQFNHDSYLQDIITRIKSKSKLFQEVKQKAIDKSVRQEEKALRECYERSEDIERHYERAKSFNEKKIMDRRRSFKQKFEKCSENLRHLSYAEEQKFHELEQKFERKSKPKEWKDERLEKYWQKWTQNSKKIEMEKDEKVESLINKHNQITMKNKLYKQKKEKLMQALKKQIE